MHEVVAKDHRSKRAFLSYALSGYWPNTLVYLFGQRVVPRIRLAIDEQCPVNVAAFGELVASQGPGYDNARVRGIQMRQGLPQFAPLHISQLARPSQMKPIYAEPRFQLFQARDHRGEESFAVESSRCQFWPPSNAPLMDSLSTLPRIVPEGRAGSSWSPN